MRYLVYSGSTKHVLACLLWSSPAWKMAARDSWIGWTSEDRARNLQLVVNNSRFLILPWVQVRNLASTILTFCARQLPRTGSAFMVIARCFWRRWLMRSFAAPVIARRTGSIWAKRVDVAGWTSITRPMGVG